ncbi:MAG: T9SS type A sorting domain-containing protein [Candidatus Marinimicrobia bacterium]|nr:T9SS type A sorting domain-containing protein [Candidatus Neomarinimicrobiota bacterium]
MQFAISQNYPNPFNPTTTISYQLPKSSFVKLTIYDISGRSIQKLIDEKKNAGYYSVDWNAENVCSGVYFYRIEAGDFVAVKKGLLVK